LPSDGGHYSGYDPALIETILAEAAYLLRHLGFAAAHTILIGGVVPSLLVLDPATHRAHIGTTDLDVCLSVAIVEGDTAEYERIETALRKAGYQPTDVSFRWRRTSRLPLEVEFFCPADDDRPAGNLFRPRAADNPTAKQNFGAKLGAIALAAGRAIESDAVVVEREVQLPEEGGKTRFAFRVTGALGFLVAKTGALMGRDKPKDAYDIVWIVENWDGGPAGVAEAIKGSDAIGLVDVRETLDRLFEEFGDVDRLGPRSYVRFMAEDGMSADDRTRLARQAVGAVDELSTALRR
jgi:hypothetical protein